MMCILFIAMAHSVHTQRWINQLHGQGWDIHLFPVDDAAIHPDLTHVTVHDFLCYKPAKVNHGIRFAGSWPLPSGAHLARRVVKRVAPSWGNRAWRLAHVIRKLRPDIVHSLEIQHAGYLTSEAKKQALGDFPAWIVTNWGSDIYLFGRLRKHKDKIRSVLSSCDYYSCECNRDVELGRTFGFRAELLPVLPIAGGFHLERMRQFRQPGPTSIRRLIVLKGYQGWAGRALVGLRAIELSADVLEGYRVAIYLAGSDVQIAAELVSSSTGIPVEIIPHSYSHEDMLRLHGRARVSIGLSISDAASTSMLESMVMGSFPIQSNTSCADEWIQCGKTGFLVHPEDPEQVAHAIRRAVLEDELVDNAAEINMQVAAKRLDYSVIQSQVIAIYERIAGSAVSKGGGYVRSMH